MPYNDSHHVVKTSAQWDERAIEFWVVPRGCLCVELTPEGKTKIKIGEGNKFYSQLPYVNDMSDLENYYTKEEVDNIVKNINLMAIRSTDEYDSKNDLPPTGNKLGDVRFVKSQSPSIKIDPDIYLWNGSRWIYVGYELQDIDLSQYLKKEEFHELFDPVREKVEEMYPKMHTHDNKNILDRIEEPYSTAEKEKLAGLHNYDDTEIRELIEETGHTHPNKPILDTITDDSLWSESDRDKFESLHNYDDTGVKNRLTDLEGVAHTHDNKNILDQVTAAFTVEDKTKLDSLHNNEVFIGTDGMYGGREGLVPGPTILDAGKFLCADGTWKAAGEIAYDFRGATATEDGTNGLVPAPLAGQQAKFLRGDGTWAKVKTGDKYRAGDGVTILSGEVVSDTFPFQVLPQAEQVTQYIIYGAPGGVGDAVTGGYRIQINASAEGHTDRSATVIIPDKMYEGDYVDYQKQVYSTYRTNVTSRVSADPNYNYDWGIYSDGRIARKDPGAYGGYPRVTALFELEPGASYEITAYNDHDAWKFENAMHINLYDADLNVTRTIAQSYSGNTTFTPAATDKYMRFAYREDIWSWTAHGRQTVWQLKDIERPCGLPELFLYPGVVNTINATTTVKPSLMYIEIEPPDDPESEDPMSEFTGIIYNDGVLDVTQEDPNAMNELTVHFRDSSKVLTIPEAEPYELPAATDSTLGGVIVSDGLSVANDGTLSVNIGDGLEFNPETGAIDVLGSAGSEYIEGRGIEFENVNISDVPTGYTQVEYIGNTGGSYILTDYSPSTDTSIEIVVNVHKGTSSWQSIFGARDGVNPGGNEYAFFGRINSTYNFYPRITGDVSSYMAGTYDEKITITIIGTVVTVTKTDGSSYSYTQTGSLGTLINELAIFALHHDDGCVDFGIVDLYSFKIYENDTLVKEYIPCFRNSDNEIGLYETVDDVFFTNDGTDTFSKGPNVIKTAINVQYGDGLEVDGNNDLNVKLGTGLQFDANGAIEATGSAATEYIESDGIEFTEGLTNTEIAARIGSGLQFDDGGVPAGGYKSLDYIQSTGTQAMNIGWAPSSTNVIYELDFSDLIRDEGDWHWLLGGYGSETCRSGGLLYTTLYSHTGLMIPIGNGEKLEKPWPTSRSVWRVEINGSTVSLFIDGVSQGSTSYSGTINTPVGLFGSGYSLDTTLTLGQIAKFKFYSLKIWQDGTLVRHFIPAMRGMDNARGIWDNVTETFIPNATRTGNDFSYGQVTGDIGVRPRKAIIAKLGDGLSFDSNDAVTVDEMVGATSQANGESGAVPQPLIADKDKFLKGDGTWSNPPTYTLPAATTTTLGGVKVGAGLSMNANDELGVTSPYVTSVTNQGSVPGVITVAKSDGTSSDVDVLDDLRLILNCNYDSSLTRNVLGEPVNAPQAGNTESSPILGDLTVLEVDE